MESSLVIASHESSSDAALLTLTRGKAGTRSFAFDRNDVFRRITVGPGPGCDWHVVTNGVAQVAIFFTGDAMWIGVERAHRLLFCNGTALTQGWTPLRHGDQLDLGEANISVSFAPDLRVLEAPSEVVPPSPTPAGITESAVAAIVRLVRGNSERASWTFRNTDLGASVSVGAGKHCDWCVATGGFEIRELSLLFAGGTLLARREQPGNRIRLDGEPLQDDWTFVASGSRLEVGLACLEVQISNERCSLPPLPPGVRLSRAGSSNQGSQSGIVLHSSGVRMQPVVVAQNEPMVASSGGAARPIASAIKPASATRQAASQPVTKMTAADKPQHAVKARTDLVLRSGGALTQVSKDSPKLAERPVTSLGRPQRHAVEMSRHSMELRRPPEAWVQACVPSRRKRSKSRRKWLVYGLASAVLVALYTAWLMLLERV